MPATRNASVGAVSIASNRTRLSPSPFGRFGARDANTPTRSFPPNRGGRTVAVPAHAGFS